MRTLLCCVDHDDEEETIFQRVLGKQLGSGSKYWFPPIPPDGYRYTLYRCLNCGHKEFKTTSVNLPLVNNYLCDICKGE